MDDTDRAPCPKCSKPVRFTARKCPFCLAPLGKQTWWKKPKFVVATFYALGLIYFSRLMYLHEHRPVYFFENYAQNVKIASSEMRFETKGGRHIVTILGTIRNDTDIPWEHLTYVARCFDKNGKLIDTIADNRTGLHTTLSAHHEQAFRVQGEANRPISEYASHKVALEGAMDSDYGLRKED